MLTREVRAAILVAFIISGCGSDPTHLETDAERLSDDIVTIQEPLGGIDGWYTGPYIVTDAKLTLKPYDGWICVLTRVAGPMLSHDNGARVGLESGSWVLRAGTGNSARANCFKQSAFVAPEGSVIRQHVGSLDCTVDEGTLEFPFYNGGGAAIINGVQGNLNSGVNEAQMTLSGDAFASNILSVHCGGGRVEAWAAWFFVGIQNNGWVAKYKTYTVNTINSPRELDFEESSMCHILGVDTDSNGNGWNGGAVHIFPSDASDKWRVTVSAGITARIGCFSRIQQ